MKIFEAYNDAKIRREYKRLLIAQGMSITAADKEYGRIGTYVSRIRGVAFDKLLLTADNETSFRSLLDYIFKDKWKDHMEYAETANHFYHYLDFLHYQKAMGFLPDLTGLDDDGECPLSLDRPGRYEERFIHSGKLAILLNPALVGQLRGMTTEDAVARCREFYPFLDPTMNDDDWKSLVEECSSVRKPRRNKATVRNIAITLPDGSRRVMEGNDCFMVVISLIGAQTLLASNVRHLRYRLVERTIPHNHKKYFRKMDDGLYVNLLGGNPEKYRTLRLLDSFFHLGLNPELCNEY
ncbi:MAG: hypothetical protein K2F71_02445, partial [Paramuribaculum sp.]|nr:hypothetical protein [Paramuribaculum sp.]